MTNEEAVWIRAYISYFFNAIHKTFPDIENYPDTRIGFMYKILLEEKDKLYGFLKAHIKEEKP
jgi:hypothetical protein